MRRESRQQLLQEQQQGQGQGQQQEQEQEQQQQQEQGQQEQEQEQEPVPDPGQAEEQQEQEPGQEKEQDKGAATGGARAATEFGTGTGSSMEDRTPCTSHADCARGHYCDMTSHCWDCTAITRIWCDPIECAPSGQACDQCCLLPGLLAHCPPPEFEAYRERCAITSSPPAPAEDPLAVAQRTACEGHAGPCVPEASWDEVDWVVAPGQCSAEPWQRQMLGAVDVSHGIVSTASHSAAHG